MTSKLNELVMLEGYSDLTGLLEEYITDSVCPAICVNEGCSYTAEMEQDQDRGWCESCGTNSMKSAMVLVGII